MQETRESFAENTTLLVLAGGRAARMQGLDKPLLEWRGKAMVEHVLESVPALPRIISANRNLDKYAYYGQVMSDAEVTLDLIRRGVDPSQLTAGPLLGVLGGLLSAKTDWVLVAAGDAPNVPQHWGECLWEVVSENPSTKVVVAHDGERQQHLHMLLHRSLSDILCRYLTGGHREVYKFLQACDSVPCRIDAAGGDFRNLNTPDDLLD